MSKSERISVVFSGEQITAIRDHCKATGAKQSDVIRDSAMVAIGRKELTGNVTIGRPNSATH